jgi:hypothetical protein
MKNKNMLYTFEINIKRHKLWNTHTNNKQNSTNIPSINKDCETKFCWISSGVSATKIDKEK